MHQGDLIYENGLLIRSVLRDDFLPSLRDGRGMMSRLSLLVIASLICLAPFSFKPDGAIASDESPYPSFPEGEVPFDRPVEEIEPYLAAMTEFKLFKELEISSCTECHDEEWETNPERRKLEEPHDTIPGELKHGPPDRWCLDCHSKKDRDKLRLLNGKLIEFREYYKLCSQCHPKIYRQWKMGIHGKVTGYWDGQQKEYWHCSQCHDPHDPPFKPQKPAPPPVRPEELGRLYEELIRNGE